MVPSEPRAGEETTLPPVSNVHFWNPSLANALFGPERGSRQMLNSSMSSKIVLFIRISLSIEFAFEPISKRPLLPNICVRLKF
jgi:hypothetical protein